MFIFLLRANKALNDHVYDDYAVPVVELWVRGVSWKTWQMLLCFPECILEGTETANSVVQHHGLKKQSEYYMIHMIQQEV
jgi:hypothetical protein